MDLGGLKQLFGLFMGKAKVKGPAGVKLGTRAARNPQPHLLPCLSDPRAQGRVSDIFSSRPHSLMASITHHPIDQTPTA